jgi:predicted phosphodiesterase
MRLAVLADIHSNLPALEAVLADLEGQAVDRIVVAGDLVPKGPNPAETIRLLRSRDALMIRGNADDGLVAYHAGDVPDAWRTSAQWAPLRWVYRHLDREAVEYVAVLPAQRTIAPPGRAPIRVVHGSPSSPSQHLYPDRDAGALALFRRAGVLPSGRNPSSLAVALAQVDEPVLVCGHSHIPWAQEQDGRLALNPGAVGTPANGDPRAQYALLTWQDGRWRAAHRAVAYDLRRVRAAYHESGLLAEGGDLSRASLLGIERGEAVFGRFISHVYGLAAEAGYGDCSVVPTDVWERAVATFRYDNE